MFYDNFFKENKVSYKNINYKSFDGIDVGTDANLMGFNYSLLTYNFDFSKGVLSDGIGVRTLRFKNYPDDSSFKDLEELPDGYHSTLGWYFSLWANDLETYRSLFFVLGSDGYIYYNWLHTDKTQFTKIDNLHFDENPYVFASRIDGDDVLFFVSKQNGTYIWKYPNIVKKIDNFPLVNSFCTYNNRCFATVKYNRGAIVYSNDLNPLNLNVDLLQGGKIELGDIFEECNKVVSFKGYLYIFTDFNIIKLSEYSNKNEFGLSKMSASKGRIFSETICVCGDVILYLASDGIYKFDGNSIKRINLSIDNLFNNVDNYYAVAGYVNGVYYLSCKLNYCSDKDVVDGEWPDGNNRNNALIKYNLESEKYTLFRGYDIVGIYIVDDVYKCEVCVLVRQVGAIFKLGMLDISGSYLNLPLTKVWNSPITDFGYPDKYKLVKELSLESKRDLSIDLIVDNKIKRFNVKGKNIPQTIKINLKCKKFGFKIISKEVDNYITNPKIKVGIL